MSMLSEFKTFILRGNVIDMAVGIVIGTAFTKVVTSLVNDVIMPPIGLAISGVDFSRLKWVLKAAGPDGKGGVAITYGAFVNTVISFIIIAFAVFVMVKVINSLYKKKQAEPAPPAPKTEDVILLGEIRDLLKNRAA
jgi:large conductance mechanosensitive channel